MKKRFTLLTLLSLATFTAANAQLNKRAYQAAMRNAAKKVANFTNTRDFPSTFKYSSIGFGLGYANYFGDLAPNTGKTSSSFNQSTPSFNVFYTKRLGAFMSVRVNAAYSLIKGDDNSVDPGGGVSAQARYLRNLSFRNQIKEIGITLHGDILPTNRGYMRRNFFNPYGFIGVNVFTNNPQALGPIGSKWEGSWVDLQPLTTEGQGLRNGPATYSTIQVGIPVGFGVRYRLAANLDLSLEFGYRLTFTNYLDDVGRNFYAWGGATADPSTQHAGVNGTAEQLTFSNRSAEAVAAVTGAERYFDYQQGTGPVYHIAIRDLVAGASTTIPTNIIQQAKQDFVDFNTPSDGGSPVSHLKGFTNGRSPRGGGGRDYYLVTGFHLGYILHDQTRAPRFR